MLALLAALLMAGCLGPSPVDHCAGSDADLLYVSTDAPTDEEARYFIVELEQGGAEEDEQAVPDVGCVAFQPASAGAYTVTATYWIDGTECAYVAEQAVGWRGERVVVVLEDYRRFCEDGP